MELKFPNNFEIKISTLGKNADKICGEMCEAGAEIVLPIVKKNLEAVIGKNVGPKRRRSTGELVKSLGISEPKVDRKGIVNVKVGFHEPRKDGEINAKIANIIEYGKTGQAPKPFMKKSKRQAKKACEAAMKAKFDEEVAKI